MKQKIIELDEYPRRQHFEYFRGMDFPYVGVTVNVDITEWLANVKAQKAPFFLRFLYCAVHAANAVPELRQRIYEEKIIEFSQCKASYTVALADGTYCYCAVDCGMPQDEFIRYAEEKQKRAKQNPSITDHEDALSLFFISSVPWFSYTALVQPVPKPADSNPRITWGKYFAQDGKILIPVSLLCHHALVDGIHIAQFYENLQNQLAAL